MIDYFGGLPRAPVPLGSPKAEIHKILVDLGETGA